MVAPALMWLTKEKDVKLVQIIIWIQVTKFQCFHYQPSLSQSLFDIVMLHDTWSQCLKVECLKILLIFHKMIFVFSYLLSYITHCDTIITLFLLLVFYPISCNRIVQPCGLTISHFSQHNINLTRIEQYYYYIHNA